MQIAHFILAHTDASHIKRLVKRLYLPGKIKVFTDIDYEFLRTRDELYVRKVNSFESNKLLDLLDNECS